jgi:hypothetical protein
MWVKYMKDTVTVFTRNSLHISSEMTYSQRAKGTSHVSNHGQNLVNAALEHAATIPRWSLRASETGMRSSVETRAGLGVSYQRPNGETSDGDTRSAHRLKRVRKLRLE